jgi:L-fucose isomerase-like protein
VSSRLGATILPIPYAELREVIRFFSQPELERSQQAITRSYAVDAGDANALQAGIKLHLALKHVAQEQNIDGFAAECWTGLPRELGLNPCLGFIEDAYTLACEGDVLLCVALLIARYLTGTSAYVGDLYDLGLDGNLTLIHCGAPASLASNNNEAVLGKSQVALERGFETLTCRPRLDTGRVTVFRFYGGACDQMHLVMGDLLSSDQSPNLTVRLKIDGDRSDFLEQCFGNHYIVVPGDLRAELKLLGKWLGITIHDTSSQER